jgi:hypothetical protein
MTNVVPLRPRGLNTEPRPDGGPEEGLRLLDNISAAAEILEAMSGEVVGAGLPQGRKEKILQALFDAVSHLEIASDELADQVGRSDT